MGTTAIVAVKVEEKYRSIYVISDGYPDYMMPILTENYSDQESAELLVSFGDALYVDERCVPNGPHSHESREDGCTVYCGRDRGDHGAEPVDYGSVDDLPGEAYAYVFDGSWRVAW